MTLRMIGFCFLLFLTGCQEMQTDAPVEKSTKRLALTYDDAPLGTGPVFSGAERTDALINQLDEAKTGPAVIFVTTRGLSADNGAARIAKYAEAGHLIANHSHGHVWASRTETETYIEDIDRAEDALSAFGNRRPWFRFPFLDEGGSGEANRDGVKRDALRSALEQRELLSGYVTIDTYDWHLDRRWSEAVREGQQVDMMALSKLYTDMVVDAANHYDRLGQQVLNRRPAHVLLLHENDLAASFTVDLVKALEKDGWQIIHPDAAFADPMATTLPETLFSGMGRISALAADQGLRDRGTLDHWSVSEQAIDARLSALGVFQSDTD